MGKRAMGKNQSKNKGSFIEVVILAFVVVSISLLALQLGTNVTDTLEQSESSSDGYVVPDNPLTTLYPSAPTSADAPSGSGTGED